MDRRLLWFCVLLVPVLVWSPIGPHDYFTWFLEVVPVFYWGGISLGGAEAISAFWAIVAMPLLSQAHDRSLLKLAENSQSDCSILREISMALVERNNFRTKKGAV